MFMKICFEKTYCPYDHFSSKKVMVLDKSKKHKTFVWPFVIIVKESKVIALENRCLVIVQFKMPSK